MVFKNDISWAVFIFFLLTMVVFMSNNVFFHRISVSNAFIYEKQDALVTLGELSFNTGYVCIVLLVVSLPFGKCIFFKAVQL